MEELLKELISIPGPCGYEHKVIAYLKERIEDKVDELHVNGLGTLIAVKRGAYPGPTVAVSAHTDEVGFIVKKIEANGLIRFEKLGGHDDRILLSQKVFVDSEKGKWPGVIGTISAHMMKFDDPKLVRNHRQLYIDVGAADSDEVKEMGIRIGDPIVWDTPWTPSGLHRVYGHAFDDRAGCAVLVNAIERTDWDNVHGTLIAIFSTQEEVGLRGAHSAATEIRPDVVVAVDTTAVSDTPEGMMDNTLKLGDGAGIKVMDASLVASKAAWQYLRSTADQAGIPYQLEIFTGIGTDAGALHMGYAGVPTTCISIPTRYAHSSIEMMDLQDFDDCGKLLIAFLERMRDPAEFAFLQQ